MTEYTPTTEEVRAAFVEYEESAEFLSADSYDQWKATGGAEGEFDRWLAERDRQVREKLWDEVVPQFAHDWYWHDGGRELNPYRKEDCND